MCLDSINFPKHGSIFSEWAEHTYPNFWKYPPPGTELIQSLLRTGYCISVLWDNFQQEEFTKHIRATWAYTASLEYYLYIFIFLRILHQVNFNETHNLHTDGTDRRALSEVARRQERGIWSTLLHSVTHQGNVDWTITELVHCCIAKCSKCWTATLDQANWKSLIDCNPPDHWRALSIWWLPKYKFGPMLVSGCGTGVGHSPSATRDKSFSFNEDNFKSCQQASDERSQLKALIIALSRRFSPSWRDSRARSIKISDVLGSFGLAYCRKYI